MPGLSAERWGVELSDIVYRAFAEQLGPLASQNAAGDLLGHVRDTGEKPERPVGLTAPI